MQTDGTLDCGAGGESSRHFLRGGQEGVAAVATLENK